MAADPVSPWRRFRDLVLAVPRRPDLRTHFAMGMALVVSVFLVGHGIESKQRDMLARQQQDPRGEVTAYFGWVPGGSFNAATSEFGGRKFVWPEEDLCVEEGLDPATRASTHVDSRSLQGQAILTSFGEKDKEIATAVLENGSRVMMRYNALTVVLSRQSTRHL